MKSGYLYVLTHPSNPSLIKVGRTTRKPEERLAQHNRDHTRLAGQIVKDTGQEWELKEAISVPDPVFAEAVFWDTTGLHRFEHKEVTHMEWGLVQMCLNKAKKAGIKPRPKVSATRVRNREWMLEQLEGTGITMIGHYRGLITGIEFECDRGHAFKEMAGRVAYRLTCPICDTEEKD